MAVYPEIIFFGIALGPVAVILILNAIFFFLLMNVDGLLGRMTKRLGPAYTKYFLFWVFILFAIFSAAPHVFGLDASDLAIIMGTIIIFGLFIPGFGMRNARRNMLVLLVSVLGSVVGYQFARTFFPPLI